MTARPTTTIKAHELLIEAEVKRICVEDGMTPVANRRFELAQAADLERAARDSLTLEQPAEVGTGGEIVPQGRDAVDYPGIACLVREPDLTAAHASRDRLKLADEAQCFDLAADLAESMGARNSVERVLLHQLGAAHAMAMRLLGRAQEELRANGRIDARGQNMANIEAARLMGACQDGLVALHRSRSGGQQIVQVVHQHVDARGGQVAVAGAVGGGGRGGGAGGGGGGGGSRRDKKGAE